MQTFIFENFLLQLVDDAIVKLFVVATAAVQVIPEIPYKAWLNNMFSEPFLTIAGEEHRTFCENCH